MFGKTEGNNLKVKSLLWLCSDLVSCLVLASLGHHNAVTSPGNEKEKVVVLTKRKPLLLECDW